MSSVSVKNITEEKVKTTSGKLENQVQITFNMLKNNDSITETIVLSGKGSVKALISV